jgi:serine/threonine protein phosphatase 1
MNCGGIAALDSYGFSGQLDLVPREHFRFMGSCLPYHETESHIFVHANYKPDLPLDRLDDHTLRWLSLRDFVPGPHCSGKVVFTGHTPQSNILHLGHLVCLDTACCDGGWLTAMDVASGTIWQVSECGDVREDPPVLQQVVEPS